MSYSFTLKDFGDFASTRGLIEPLKQLTLRVVFKFRINDKYTGMELSLGFRNEIKEYLLFIPVKSQWIPEAIFAHV